MFDRSRPGRWTILILMGAIATAGSPSGCASTEPVPELIVEPEIGEWNAPGIKGGRVIRTEHFEVYTNIRDDDFIALLPRFLEAAHFRYEGLIPPRVEKPQRLTTYLYQRRGDWERHVADNYPRRAHVYRRIQSGAFSEGTTSVAYYLTRAKTLSVLAHEGFHQYVAAHVAADLPAWLNEGLAAYSESFEFHKGEATFIPERNADRLRSLQDAINGKTLLPLRDVLRTHAGEVVVATDRRVYSYYAQAWALMLFLHEDATYAVGLQALLTDLGSPSYRVGIGGYVAAAEPVDGVPINPAEAAFRKYIAEDLDLFASRFDAYMRKLAFGN